MAYLRAGEWDIHASPSRGTLQITEIDELGRVTGTVFGELMTGWWSERARRVTFLRPGLDGDTRVEQGFEGYAWDEPGDEGSRRYYLAGSLATFGGGGGAKDRQSFGWFATLGTDGSTRRA
jgi:hypothetical protein